MIDWGQGSYELIAPELAPVAEHVISLAQLNTGDRVLDIGTSTGNVALLAAGAAAAVTGVDTSRRLIEVARARAAEAGAEISLAVGDAQALPFHDGSFDVALSVFGVIFAADADRAFGELMRVLTSDGRALVSVWVPA